MNPAKNTHSDNSAHHLAAVQKTFLMFFGVGIAHTIWLQRAVV